MNSEYWHKQTVEEPLFPELLWSRPENKQHAGKLLIVGGNLHGFTAPATAYGASLSAGIGAARVILPDALQKAVGKVFPKAEFVPSTPSGSFARKSLAEILDAAKWANSVLLAGDFGHNSETAIMLEALAQKYSSQLTLTGDSLEYFKATPQTLVARADTTLVMEFQQLQQLAKAAHFEKAITSTMDLLHLLETLHEFTKRYATNIIVSYAENICVAVSGQVSTTRIKTQPSIISLAAHTATWWLQNPSKPFEAITTSLLSPS